MADLKLSMYIGHHDANNVSTFGGDPVTQLYFKKTFYGIMYAVLRIWRSIAVTRAVTVSAAVVTR